MTCGVGWPWVLRAWGLEECSAAVESHRLPEASNGRDFLFCRELEHGDGSRVRLWYSQQSRAAMPSVLMIHVALVLPLLPL